MKKFIIALLMGLFLFPLGIDAKKYKIKKADQSFELPIKSQVQDQIGVNVNTHTGDLFICPNYSITGLQVRISAYGVTFMNITLSLDAWEVYTDNISFLAAGTYTMTLSTVNEIIDEYDVIVEDD